MKKLGNKVSGKNILITGGTGSFGYQMTDRLLSFNETKITILSRDEDEQRKMKSFFNSDRLKFKLGDVRDYDRLSNCMKNQDIILHAAALKQISSVEFNPMEAIKTNALSAYNLLKASAKENVETLIGISTDKAVKPINSYGISKAMMEKIIMGNDVETDVRCGCVRYGNVLGSRGSVLPIWDRLISENKPLPITSKFMRRFFLTLEQATDLILFAIENINTNEIFVRDAPAMFISDLARAYAYLKTGNKQYELNIVGIRTGEKIDELLYAKEETVTKIKYANDTYFRINRQYDHDRIFDNKEDYGSNNARQISEKQIIQLLKKVKWMK